MRRRARAAAGRDPPELAPVLADLADLHRRRGRTTLRPCRAEARRRGRGGQLRRRRPRLAVNLNNLALLQADRGDWREADALLARAAGIEEAALGPRQPRARRDAREPRRGAGRLDRREEAAAARLRAGRSGCQLPAVRPSRRLRATTLKRLDTRRSVPDCFRRRMSSTRSAKLDHRPEVHRLTVFYRLFRAIIFTRDRRGPAGTWAGRHKQESSKTPGLLESPRYPRSCSPPGSRTATRRPLPDGRPARRRDGRRPATTGAGGRTSSWSRSWASSSCATARPTTAPTWARAGTTGTSPTRPWRRCASCGIVPIVDLCHFGVPDWLGNFQNPDLPAHFADYAGAFAERYPWVRLYTPVNEIYVAATVLGQYGWWNERLSSDRGFVTRPQAPRARRTCWRCGDPGSAGPTRVFIQSEILGVLPRRGPGLRRRGRASQRDALPVARPHLRPPGRRRDVRVPAGQRHDPRGVPLVHRAPACGPHCVMGTDYYATNEHLCCRDGTTMPSGEIFGYYVITRQYYDRYRPAGDAHRDEHRRAARRRLAAEAVGEHAAAQAGRRPASSASPGTA